MSLSNTAVKNAKPKDRPYKLTDGDGLYAFVKPNSSILWRMDFMLRGVRKTLSFGSYPAIGLADARAQRDAARNLLTQNIDPSMRKKADAAAAALAEANTFRVLALEYLDRLRRDGAAEGTLYKNEWLLMNLAEPLHIIPMKDVTAADILAVLKRVEKSGRLESARRLRGAISSVFRLAVSTLRASSDPTYALRGATKSPKVEGRAALVDEKHLGRMMGAIDEYDGWPTVRAALLFSALVVCRPVEVRKAEWREFNLDGGEWRIPGSRMKMKDAHAVPLSRQALVLLRDLHQLSGTGDLVFPSIRSSKKALSEGAMNAALRRMGILKTEHTAHGFRSSFSTILNSRGFDENVIEHALAHKDSSVRGVYNRSRYWEDRKVLMQAWADLLDEFRKK